MNDDRNKELILMTVVKVERLSPVSTRVRVTAASAITQEDPKPANTLEYVTNADRAPRVGIDVMVSAELVR